MQREIIDRIFVLARNKEFIDVIFTAEHPFGINFPRDAKFIKDFIQNSKQQEQELENYLEQLEIEVLRKIIALMYYGRDNNMTYEIALETAFEKGREDKGLLIQTLMGKSPLPLYLYMALSKLLGSGKNVSEL
jgi:hypothetical protein